MRGPSAGLPGGRAPITRHLVLLSGGIDSAAALSECSARAERSEALFVDYGQPASAQERAASSALAMHFGVPWEAIEVAGIEVPDGEIAGRNALLAHLALTFLAGAESSCLYLGIHAGTPYRDCSPEFVAETQRSLDFQSGGGVRLIAPYVGWSKEMVVERGRELGVPFELTHSCERSSLPCGECPSCIDRQGLIASA